MTLSTSGQLSYGKPFTVTLCRLHRAFDLVAIAHNYANRSIRLAFQDVTPSFHPLGYQFYETDILKAPF